MPDDVIKRCIAANDTAQEGRALVYVDKIGNTKTLGISSQKNQIFRTFPLAAISGRLNTRFDDITYYSA